jgi:hypothetical protein
MLVGLPAYFYPWPGGSDWWRLSELGGPLMIIANPATGPGTAVDYAYLGSLADARRSGAQVLGYIDDAYGSRPLHEMVDEMGRYRDWYGVDGVFLDRTRGDSAALDRTAPLSAAAHDAGLLIAVNPGQPEVDPRFLAITDHVVLFEGDLAAYARSEFRAWVHLHDRATVWHLVYGVPAEALDAVAALAVQRHAGVLFATDLTAPHPWSGLPTYWPDQPGRRRRHM